MRIIFLKDVKNVGRVGEIKEISDGYAKNFLLPKSLAKIATKASVNEIESRKQKEQQTVETLKARLKEVESASNKDPIVLKVKVGEHNEVFGGIHETDIQQALTESGYQDLKLE